MFLHRRCCNKYALKIAKGKFDALTHTYLMQYVNWWRASRKDPPYAGWLLFLLTVLVSPHWSVGQIERVFSAASHKKVWDHFTKAQRKNIEMWKKQCAVRTCWAESVQIWFSVRRCKMEVLVQWLTGWWYMRFKFLIMVSIRVWHCAVTYTGINIGEACAACIFRVNSE